MTKSLFFAGLSAAALMAAPVSAEVVTLNFEGIAPGNASGVQILDYYNGGTSSAGTSGPDLGVSFSDTAITLCLNTLDVTCTNSSRGGQGDPASQFTGLFFLEGSETYLNYGAGFTDGFSFFYSSANTPGSVGVYSGLNGTGDLLATIDLPVNSPGCPEYSAAYCPFTAAGVSFTGTALSIGFGGVANYIAFDDVTFGSAIPGDPGAVPEPESWALMLTGFGLAGAGLRRRRRNTLASAV
jgi:hypothetical protein